VVAVYRERWSEPDGDLRVYLHGVHDPGNVGTIIRSAHALADGPVILGPDCADPFSPKAVRATMGSLFARPPARVQDFGQLRGTTIALEAREGRPLQEIDADPPVTLCVGAERHGLPAAVIAQSTALAHIPLMDRSANSLNVAVAASVALYERTRMRGHA
jgi:TrmH family RNA methyltransferase